MVRQRGIARISTTRRRIFRIKTKWTHHIVPRRFKVMEFQRRDELLWELDVMDQLEKECFAKLQTLGILEQYWRYYLGYAKRLWVRALKFSKATYALERESLRSEYIRRGWLASVLDALEPFAVALALLKKARIEPIFLEVFVAHM